MNSSSRALGALALVLGGLVPLTTVAADAATTSSGLRCTIVGSAGDDVLVGTPRRDVICGRGGDDVIRAGSGDDVVDGGDGADRILGGDGDDLLLGLAGDDRIDGQAGRDEVRGGDGDDQIAGGFDADVLTGGDGSDQIDGHGGDDRLDGGRQDDLLVGGAGADRLDGGGHGALCLVLAADRATGCRADTERPTVLDIRWDRAQVDVTDASQTVVLRARVRDAGGVDSVNAVMQGGADFGFLRVFLAQSAGTPRDGWWRGTLTIPRWMPAARLRAEISAVDRSGNGVYADATTLLEVTDADPDPAPPRPLDARVTPSSVDVRTRAQDVTLSVRLADERSGTGRVDLCLVAPGPVRVDGRPRGYDTVRCVTSVRRTSGTVRDGWWTTTLRVPQGAVSGTYDIRGWADDRSTRTGRILGPRVYDGDRAENDCCFSGQRIPGDGSLLQVRGTPDDREPVASR